MDVASHPPVVWVVDDSALEARSILRALGDEFVCETFCSGSGVLERLATGDSPSVLLLDWELPDMSGVEVCRFVRTTRDELALPILLVTGRQDTTDVVAGLSAGANDFVTKPYHPTVLLARVKSLARSREIYRDKQRADAEREAHQAVAHERIEAAALALQHSEERLRRVIESSGAGLWELDPATGEVTADRRMVALMGLPEGSSFNLASGLDQLSADDGARVAAAVAAALAGEDGGRYLVEFRTGGRGAVPLRWVESRAATVFDAHGAALRLQGAMIDITARKLAELERDARAEFERQLIGIVSHDLRSPLSTILLGAQLLLAGDGLGDKSIRALSRIQAAAERGARLVNDLLDFTQARVGGGIPIASSPGNLHALVRQVVDDIAPTAPEREIRVTTSGDGNGTWDLDRMSQVITNLIGNALKYSAPDSVIKVTSHADADGVVVAVHNRGTPISAEALARIFRPMQRATSQHENKARSVGLGLFIVKHLLDAHRGRISVSSTADAGTAFSFWVPRHAPVATRDAGLAASPRA